MPQIPTYGFKLQLVANCATLYKSLKYSLKQKYLLDMEITMNKIKCGVFFISVSHEVYKNCIYVEFNGLDTAPHVKFIVDIYSRDKIIFLSSINSTSDNTQEPAFVNGYCFLF